MPLVKEDARVIKTKERLLETFQKLIDEKKFEDITVNEICTESGIRRATFYKHFTDKYDFLRFFVKSLRDGFDDRMWKNGKPATTAEYFADYARSVVAFLLRNEDVIYKALESNVLPTIIEIVKEQNYIDTRIRLEKSVEAGLVLPASIDVVAMMLTGAVTHTLVAWFSDGRKIPENVLVEEVCTIVNMMLK